MSRSEPKAIVRGTRGTHADVLFLMRKSDSRYVAAGYEHIVDVTKLQRPSDNFRSAMNRPLYVATAADKRMYWIFADWSAREIS